MSYIEIHAHTRSELYSIIPNHIINATYLQLDAKGLMAWMLSKQHLKKAWSLSLKSISTQLNTGLSKIKRIVKELQESDHLRIQRLATGQTVWHVYEEQNDCKRDRGFKKPQVDNQLEATYIQEKPQVEKPHVEKPHVENQPVLQSNDLIQSNDQIQTHTANQNSKIQAGDHLIPAGQEPHITRPSKQPNNQPAKQKTFYNAELRPLTRDQMEGKIDTPEFQEFINEALNIPAEDIAAEWHVFMMHRTMDSKPHYKWLAEWSSFANKYRPKTTTGTGVKSKFPTWQEKMTAHNERAREEFLKGEE